MSEPEIAAVERSERSDELEHEAQSARMVEERSTESSRNAATRSATGTKWDQAVRGFWTTGRKTPKEQVPRSPS
jgi:hypothetical protein